jgi:hypothetical protein
VVVVDGVDAVEGVGVWIGVEGATVSFGIGGCFGFAGVLSV